MPVEFTARYFDANDPDDYLARLVAGRGETSDVAESPWVEPDYASIPDDANVPLAEEDRELVWPGPAMIMPAGVLPDGKPYSRDDRDNASRICGEPVRSGAEADAVVRAYDRQQDALRQRGRIPLAHRGARGKLEDTLETTELIKQLHAEEQARRQQGHRRAG